MSNPRLTTSFNEINIATATFLIDNSTITYSVSQANGSAQVGKAVKLSTNATVALAGDGEHVVGKLMEVFKDNTCTVQVGGFATLPGGTSATLTVGTGIVGDQGGAGGTHNGYIQSASGTAQALLRNGMIISAASTASVVVNFG